MLVPFLQALQEGDVEEYIDASPSIQHLFRGGWPSWLVHEIRRPAILAKLSILKVGSSQMSIVGKIHLSCKIAADTILKISTHTYRIRCRLVLNPSSQLSQMFHHKKQASYPIHELRNELKKTHARRYPLIQGSNNLVFVHPE